MNVPWELILTVTLSALGGALIPAIGLWLQAVQGKRELSLRHEEELYRRRLDLALDISRTFYDYMFVSHGLKYEKSEQAREAYLSRRFELGKQINEHESQVVLLSPKGSVSAFRRYWRAIDDIRASRDIHWTAVGSRLDETYAELVNSLRLDLGIESVENRLVEALVNDQRKSDN